MSPSVDAKTCVVIPNWNGVDSLPNCLDSLLNQSLKASIVVVENGSTDGSLELLQKMYPMVDLVVNQRNLGFAGGVNGGIRKAQQLEAKYIALFNNDAVADKHWLKHLVDCLDKNPEVGIATPKILSADGKHLDSTGDFYTTWGLPYPRGRGETELDKYDGQTEVFGASGGASLYRDTMFDHIGLFDEDFFAYYEDVDISFRAQLAGWKVRYVPQSMAYHQIGATSTRVKGFTTYQTIKNLPLLLWKNVPSKIMPYVWIRLVVAWSAFVLRALSKGLFWPVIIGCLAGSYLWPKKLVERSRISKKRQVSDEYIWSVLVHDLPPNAKALRQLRSRWWRLKGKPNG